MRATFILRGFSGGKYTLDFELFSIPRPGDHIFISRPQQNGTENFVVTRTAWHLHYPEANENDESVGETREITIECERANEWAPSWDY